MIESYKCTDDMESLSEIYTVDELISRLSILPYPTYGFCKSKLLKGVSLHKNVMKGFRYASYYGTPAVRINRVTNEWERIPPLTLSKGS